jgi:hypothetical protein
VRAAAPLPAAGEAGDAAAAPRLAGLACGLAFAACTCRC